MIPKNQIDIQYILGAFRRRFWSFVVPLVLIFSGAVVYCLKAPKLYKAQTLILVEPQKVPSDYIRSTVTVELGDRLRTITEQITSRTRLEAIIRRHDVYPEIRASKTMTDAVTAFRQNIGIQVRSSTSRSGSGGSFEISYINNDPVKARDVTNAIAAYFIHDNLKLREEQAIGTSQFLDRELKRIQEDLRRKESKLREFKEKYLDFLPEHMQKNYQMMGHLERRLESTNTPIQQTKDRVVLLESQLSGIDRMAASTRLEDWGTIEDEVMGQSEDLNSNDMEELRQEIGKLRVRYSDRHPDVIRLKGAIAKLEEEQASADDSDSNPQATLTDEESVPTNEGPISDTALDDVSFFDAQKEDLSAQLRLARMEIAKLETEKKKTEGEIQQYRARIESSPKIEQMLIETRRGYEEAYENYQSLLKKKLDAKLSENLERTQQGEQFRILDHAVLPDRPFVPEVKKVLAIGFVLALACGIGLVYLREYADTTFWDADHLESDLQLPALVTVPVVYTESEQRRNLAKKIGTFGVLASVVSILLYALYVLWKMESFFLSIPEG